MIVNIKSKNCEFESIQYNGKNLKEIHDWSNKPVMNPNYGNPIFYGGHTLVENDWIIKLNNGEFIVLDDGTFNCIFIVK